MNYIKDLEEFAICSDIAARMALFAMAKSLSGDEINSAFDIIGNALFDDGGYEKDKVEPLIEMYRDAAITISEGLK